MGELTETTGVVFGAGVTELLATLTHPFTVLVAVTAVVLFTIIGLPDWALLHVNSPDGIFTPLPSLAVMVDVPSQLSAFDNTGAAGVLFIVIICVLQVVVFAHASVAVHVIVCVPTLKTAPSSDVPVPGFTPASVEYVTKTIPLQLTCAAAVASHNVPEFAKLVPLDIQTVWEVGQFSVGGLLVTVSTTLFVLLQPVTGFVSVRV